MEEATELTYENMERFCRRYFSRPRGNQGYDEDKVREFYAPDAKIIRRYSPDDVGVDDREQWIKRVRKWGLRFRVDQSWDKPPLGIIIDERKKMAVQIFEEVFRDLETGEMVDTKPLGFENNPEYRVSVWEFCIHDNKVKAKSQLIIRPLVDPL